MKDIENEGQCSLILNTFAPENRILHHAKNKGNQTVSF
jgi:hypothetical protein